MRVRLCGRLLRIIRRCVALLAHYRHRLAGIGVHDVIGRLLARAGADIVTDEAKFILVEGNYLLLKDAPWNRLKPLFDFTVFLDVPEAELERRLMQRWLGFDFTPERAKAWIASNDMPNVRTVRESSAKADLTLSF